MKKNIKGKNEKLVIGLDCSTTGIKAIAFDKHGNIKAHAHESIPLYSPQTHYYEQNPDDWWISARKVLKKITSQIDAKKISAIAISNQRETFVPLNKEGKKLRPAIIWLDERCRDEVGSFSNKIGKLKIHRITGKPPDYAPVVYRVAWMKKNEPELFKKTAMICDVHTYMVKKLAGVYKTSWASADPLGLFDLKNKKWSSLILKNLELNEDQLPEAHCPGTILGKITREASKLTGLSEDVLVVAGGGDGQSCGLAVNALYSERAYLNLGTAVVAGIYGNRYRISKAFRTMNSISERGYYYECSLRAGTFMIDWFIRNILCVDPKENPGIYKELEQEAGKASIGCNNMMALPYLCGAMNPYWDTNARGAFVGLSSFHNRAYMYRAILEGIAFEQLLAIDAVEKATGIKLQEFVIIGGGASSNLWIHILSDITGRNILIPETTEASSLGAGISAAVGAGWFKTFKEAADAMTGIKKTIKPDDANHKIYKGLYKKYKRIYPSLSFLK